MARRMSEELTSLPLDTQMLEVTKNGKIKKVPAIHIGFAEQKLFVPYKSPWVTNDLESPSRDPQTIAEADKEEWMERMAFLNEDFEWLLKLPHQRFWCQVIFDESLHKCLASFLTNSPRFYDMEPIMPSSVLKEIYQNVHHLVFLIYLRMSTFKESKSCHLNPTNFGTLIYDHFLFDIPTLMDLCVLYGKGNQALLFKMIENIFVCQAKYNEDLYITVPSIFQAFETIEAKLGIHHESKFDSMFKLSGVDEEEKSLANLDLKELEDTILYLVDVCLTLHSFLDIYSPACEAFHQQQAESKIASFYNNVFSLLRKELESRRSNSSDIRHCEGLIKRLTLAKCALLKTFRDILLFSCIQPLLDTRDENSNQCQNYVENFLTTLCSCLHHKNFICDYQSNFPFEDDLEMLSLTKYDVDETRTQFILNSIYTQLGVENIYPSNGSTSQPTKNDTLASLADKSNEISSYIQAKSQSSNWNTNFGGVEGATASCKVTGVELDSLISSVLDVFPDLGNGFVEMCLDYFNYKTERLINHLLEDSLPAPLRELDRKLVKPEYDHLSFLAAKPSFSDLVSERKNIYDNDEMELNFDPTKLHRGKKDTVKGNQIGSLVNDQEQLKITKEIAKRYEILVEYTDPLNDQLYDDEYDDTYDDTTQTWAEEKTLPDEIAFGRSFTVPRILRNPNFDDGEDDEEEEESEGTDSQNEYLKNPNRVGEQEASIGDRGFNQGDSSYRGRGGKDYQPYRPTSVRGKPKGQGQDQKTVTGRRNKEQNKGAYANHNRRAQSDRKRAGGMF